MRQYNIPIFVPHKGCPFDCVFCNQRRITGTVKEICASDVTATIEQYLLTLPESGRYVEAAFFGGSFTGIDKNIQRTLLCAAYQYVKSGQIDGIRISTRPDYIDRFILEQLAEFGVKTIELGVQSLDETVLIASNRGHTAQSVTDAVNLIREYPFRIGLQMMTGLPEDTPQKSIDTAQKILALKPDMVRIYPTLVIKDTYLETMYRNGEYRPQAFNDAVELCKQLLLIFEGADIPVIRMSLAATDEISLDGAVVAGPFHAAFRELVESGIYYDKMCQLIDKKEKTAKFAVHPKELSKAIGNKKENIKKLKRIFDIQAEISGRETVKKGEIVMEQR